MEKQDYSTEPNLIAEAYRTLAANKSQLLHSKIEKHFDFVDISDDGLILLGTSNLNGRVWSGSVWVYDTREGTVNIENWVAGTEFESSVASGLWIDGNKKVFVGCDSGSLHHLSINKMEDKKSYFTTDGIITEHDDSIVTMDFMKKKSKLVSGSMDMNIKVWDVEVLASEKSYCPAHGHLVTSVSSSVEFSDTFASTSLDGTALLWDIRQEKPASLILENESGYMSSAWIDENCIAVGSIDGSVSLVDLKTKREFDRSFTSKRPIFKFKYNKEFDLLAVCADDPFVRVFNCQENSLTCVYESDKHEDFVRGLAWVPASCTLYSCGWDKKILTHNINTIGNLEESSKDAD